MEKQIVPPVRLSVRPSVCPSLFRVRSISFEPLVGFTNKSAHAKYDEMMCSEYVKPRSVQDSILKIV